MVTKRQGTATSDGSTGTRGSVPFLGRGVDALEARMDPLRVPGEERAAVAVGDVDDGVDVVGLEPPGEEEVRSRLLVLRAAERSHVDIGRRRGDPGANLAQGRQRRRESRKASTDDVHGQSLARPRVTEPHVRSGRAIGSVTARPPSGRRQARSATRLAYAPAVTTLGAGEAGGILAIVPAHDEAPRIARVVEAAMRHLPVLVVDDGSADETAAVAEAAGATVLRHSPNQGKGAALRAGFSAALTLGAEAVITLDGDGQHDPAEIPTFLGAYARRALSGEPSELIVGRRDFRRMPPVRRLANWLGTLTLSAAVGRWIADNQSGYRLVGRRLMAAMLDTHESGFAFEVEMIAVCLREDWPIDWVPVRTIYGDERSHIRPGQHLREFLTVTGKARQIARSAPESASGARPAPREG